LLFADEILARAYTGSVQQRLELSKVAPVLAFYWLARIALRGGTAINKLLFQKPLHYSEYIYLVQTRQEPIRSTCFGIGARMAIR
jgi:hypothetical protein